MYFGGLETFVAFGRGEGEGEPVPFLSCMINSIIGGPNRFRLAFPDRGAASSIATCHFRW